MAKISWIACLGIVVCGSASALEVIYDTGRGVSAQPYYQNIQIDTSTHQQVRNQSTLVEQLMQTKPPSSEELKAQWQKAADDPNVYPIESLYLTPGKVEKKSLAAAVQSKVSWFVIGNDKLSLEWMKTNARHLVSIKAVGYLISVESREQYDRIKAYAKDLGLTVMTYQGSFVFQQMGVSHYPFVVNGSQIYQ